MSTLSSKREQYFRRRKRSKKVKNVYFDRNGFRYHGRVKSLAEASREGGLKF